MHITGKCFCGDVRFEAEVNENTAAICHCTSCQGNSGSAFRVVVFGDEESFKLLQGQLTDFQHVADSGTTRSRPFCPKCGTPIYAKSVGGGLPMIGFRVGTLDQRYKLVPNFQVWCRSAQPWAIVKGLPQFETQPDPDDLKHLMAG